MSYTPFTRYNRLSNRFDNRLYRVNGALQFYCKPFYFAWSCIFQLRIFHPCIFVTFGFFILQSRILRSCILCFSELLTESDCRQLFITLNVQLHLQQLIVTVAVEDDSFTDSRKFTIITLTNFSNNTEHTYIHTYIHTNLYSAKIVERIWGASPGPSVQSRTSCLFTTENRLYLDYGRLFMAKWLIWTPDCAVTRLRCTQKSPFFA